MTLIVPARKTSMTHMNYTPIDMDLGVTALQIGFEGDRYVEDAVGLFQTTTTLPSIL